MLNNKLLLFLSGMFCCVPVCAQTTVKLFDHKSGSLIDKDATKETRALYSNLHKLSAKHILFGHQHATEYGHGWSGDENRSDVKSVTGSHPAVIGVDFSGLSGRPGDMI